MHRLHARFVTLGRIISDILIESNSLLPTKMKSKALHQLSCAGMNQVTVSSPIGDIQIHSCQAGLHLVKQIEADDTNFSPDESLMVKVKLSSSKNMTTSAEECIEWLKDYFSHGVAKLEIPELCPTLISDKGSFRSQAWCGLPKAVPLGKTITYAQLAKLCGSPRAYQAAGSAMSTNPISFLIPCHRVLPSTGGVGNYSQGTKNSIKAWLLDYEQRRLS